MCKLFKIKTSSGLVTQTTDPEIVRCLLDNYDGELSIETKKQTCDEQQSDETGMAVCTDTPESTEDGLTINVQPCPHEKVRDRIIYLKALKDALDLRLFIAKEYVDNGFKIKLNTETTFNSLIDLLNASHIPYTIEK